MTTRQFADPTPSKVMLPGARHETVTTVGVIRPDGLWFYSCLYQSAELRALRNRMGRSMRVMVGYDPGCLDFLCVLDPFNKTTLKVPRVDNGRGNNDIDERRRALKLDRELAGSGAMQMVSPARCTV